MSEGKITANGVYLGDCLELLRSMPDKSVDLVFTSPPYEAARTYGIDFKLKGQEWVDWCVERFMECLRVCRGLVAWNVEGQTRQFRWSATPALLMADLHRRGVKLRKPPIFQRVGIPGSGGPDWLRNDYEFIVCATGGKLPWSANTAMGHPPKTDGSRVNQWGGTGGTTGNRKPKREKRGRPSHRLHTKANGESVLRENRQVMTKDREGTHQQSQVGYTVPAIANPGNVLKGIVGGGVMGSGLAHENEAPFPEMLPEFFIRSFCPEGGTVLDPFCGSGTALAVADRWGRKWIGVDIRQSQVDLSRRRIAEVERSRG